MGGMQGWDEQGAEVRGLLMAVRDEREDGAGDVDRLIARAESARGRRRLVSVGAGLACAGLVGASALAVQGLTERDAGGSVTASGTAASAAGAPAPRHRTVDDALEIGVLPASEALPPGTERQFAPEGRAREKVPCTIRTTPMPRHAVRDEYVAARGSIVVHVMEFASPAEATAYVSGPARAESCTRSGKATGTGDPSVPDSWAWASAPETLLDSLGEVAPVGDFVVSVTTNRPTADASTVSDLVAGVRARLVGTAALTPVAALEGAHPKTETGIPFEVMVDLPGLDPVVPMGGVLTLGPDVDDFQVCDTEGGNRLSIPGLPAPIDTMHYVNSSDPWAENPKSVAITANRYAEGQGDDAWQHLVANTGRCVWWGKAPASQPWPGRQGLILTKPDRHLTGVVVRVDDFIISLSSNSTDFGPQGAAQQAAVDAVVARLRDAGLVN